MKKFLYIVVSFFVSLSILICSFIYKKSVYTTQNNASVHDSPIVIIDAGHGGIDGGAVAADGTQEKDINLNISKHLEKFLAVFGLKSVMIRETDTSVEDEGLNTIREKKTSDLHNRMKVMKETDNSIFISIHQNKFSVEKYNGTQVFYSPKTSEESALLAQCIQDSVVNTLQKDNTRQIKECGTSVYLMYNAVKPAVLVECGFLSNHAETEKLKTPEYQKKMAFCIALGIQNYISYKE